MVETVYSDWLSPYIFTLSTHVSILSYAAGRAEMFLGPAFTHYALQLIYGLHRPHGE